MTAAGCNLGSAWARRGRGRTQASRRPPIPGTLTGLSCGLVLPGRARAQEEGAKMSKLWTLGLAAIVLRGLVLAPDCCTPTRVPPPPAKCPRGQVGITDHGGRAALLRPQPTAPGLARRAGDLRRGFVPDVGRAVRGAVSRPASASTSTCRSGLRSFPSLPALGKEFLLGSAATLRSAAPGAGGRRYLPRRRALSGRVNLRCGQRLPAAGVARRVTIGHFRPRPHRRAS